MAKVIVFGDGQMAEIAHVYLTHDSEHEVVAFVVDKEYMQKDSFRGLSVVAFQDIEKVFPPSEYAMFIPIGAKRVNRLRAEKYAQAKAMGYRFVSYISSKATVCPESHIGENVFLLENNVVQPFAEIGNNVVLWSGNHIGHHSRVQDHCFLTSQVVVCGRVTIGQFSYIGVNATIRDGISIGEHCVIGARALIMRSTENDQVFVERATKLYPYSSDTLEIA